MFNINTLKLYFYIFNNYTKMLAEYMQKIESLISPNNYSRENFKQKIIETSKNNDEQYTFEPDDILKKTSKDSIENLMSTNEQINKLKKENEGKLELPEEIVIKHQDSIKSEGVPPRHFKIKNREYTEKDIQLLLEKVHGLNLKNMNYRYEIEKYKTQLNESIKEKNNYKLEIEKLEKQKENLTKYLLKLEENLSNSQKTNEGVPFSKNLSKRTSVSNYNNRPKIKCESVNNNVNISLNKSNNSEILSSKKSLSIFSCQNISIDVAPNYNVIINDITNQKTLNISSRQELKSFLLKIYNENQKLKTFQSQVFELSKTYDDINDNLLESIRNIQSIVESKESKDMEKELLSNYQKLVENVDKTLQTKQNEYNSLLKAKEEENQIVQEEILNLNAEIQVNKRDRLKDQQIILNLEQENQTLKEKLSSFEEGENTMKMKNDYRNEMRVEKKIDPVRKTVGQIMKRIEKNFDLDDQGNVNMLGTINSTLKK